MGAAVCTRYWGENTRLLCVFDKKFFGKKNFAKNFIADYSQPVQVNQTIQVRNITGTPVSGDDLFGRESELRRLWSELEKGNHLLMLAPRRVGKTSLMLELNRNPKENWDVIFINVEGGSSAADFVATMLSEMAQHEGYRRWFEALPFWQNMKRASASIKSIGLKALRIELSGALDRDWGRAMDQLATRLAGVPDGRHLLMIVDELPILVARLLQSEEGRPEAELLLAKLRSLRQAKDLRGKAQMLLGGSIGLEGVVRRAGLSALINDITPFRLESWNASTAIQFLEKVNDHRDFALDHDAIRQVLALLKDPVPYHVQLFYSAIHDSCSGDSSRVSPTLIERCFAERLTGSSGTPHLAHYAERLAAVFDHRELEAAHNILGLACRTETGIALHALGEVPTSERTALRELKADGYLDEQGGRIAFRSNLLRTWWRKNQGAGAAQ